MSIAIRLNLSQLNSFSMGKKLFRKAKFLQLKKYFSIVFEWFLLMQLIHSICVYFAWNKTFSTITRYVGALSIADKCFVMFKAFYSHTNVSMFATTNENNDKEISICWANGAGISSVLCFVFQMGQTHTEEDKNINYNEKVWNNSNNGKQS